MKTRKLFSTLFLCLLLAISSGSNVRSQSTQTCANGSRSSRLSFTVIDQKGESPSDLTAEDVTLKVDGNPTPVLSLNRQTDLPIDLAVLIDVSVSQERALSLTKPAAKALIQEFLRSSDNRVALVSFSNQIEVEKLLTSDVSPLLAALDNVKVVYPPGYMGGGLVVSGSPPPRNSRLPGSTSLWDTSSAAVENIFPSAGEETRRRVVVLLTDGEDTASQGKLNAAIKSALDHNVAVYSIGMESGSATVKRDSLKKISEETGGVASFPRKREDLITALVEIQKRLGPQYLVSFCREAQKPLKIRLELTDPKFRDARLAYRRQ